MTKNKIKSEKLNNKGFSLVEILVSIIIIAVVSSAVLASLVNSTRYNAKAKDNQYITGAAQSIMEGVKANNIDNLIAQFDDSDLIPFTVYTNLDPGGSPVTGYSCNYDLTHERNVDDVFEFEIDGIDYQGHIYDSLIKISPYNSTTAVDTPYDGTSYDGQASIDYIENMNGFRDAVFMEPLSSLSEGYYTMIDEIITWLNTMAGSYSVNAHGIMVWQGHYNREVLKADMSGIEITRNTTVDITSLGSNVSKVTVTVDFEAKVTNKAYVDSTGHTQHASRNFTHAFSTEEIFDNSLTASAGSKLENVFLFLYPAYYEPTASYDYPIDHDNYFINNSGSDINVFFVKQRNGTLEVGGSNLLGMCEAQYSPNITCNNHVKLYHNCNENISSTNTVTTPPNIVATFASEIVDGLTETEDQNLVYLVEVNIYNSGDRSEVLYTLTSTTNDK